MARRGGDGGRLGEATQRHVRPALGRFDLADSAA
jgi:hypothetical protein